MEPLSKKLLASLGGWDALKRAAAMHAAGRVTEAAYDPPLLKGKLTEGGKSFFAGLRMRNAIDVENLCPCRDSRSRGMICAHSLAVGLAVLEPHPARSEQPAPAPDRPSAPGSGEIPEVSVTIEGSLRHLEAQWDFHYATPGARNPAFETEVMQEALRAGFRDQRGKAALQGEENILTFFSRDLPRWKSRWSVTTGERFNHVTRDLVRIEPHFAIREQSDSWLEVGIHFTAGRDAVFTQNDLAALLRGGRGHVRLKDGRIAVADSAAFDDIEEVLRDCQPRQEAGKFRIPPVARGYFESSVAAWTGATPPTPIPPKLGSLHTILRPYQRDGAAWMLDLARRGLGGLLADEMGLGKTVQTLAMVECLPGPALVVCPSSLVWNWQREAERFLPNLRVLALNGPDRAKDFPRIRDHDLIVTSYALLRRDVAAYRELPFAAVILDEAQHIKNPGSQNAKSACALTARSRFILTGTPIENTLRDLWSLFEFLLPGYLGTQEDFRERYEAPLEAGAKGAVWSRLQRRLAPALLRRRKADILDDLPPKLEQILEVDLTPTERTAYVELQLAARQQIDALARENSGAARMRALTALLRLRQACCDLRLLGRPTDEPSSKLTTLVEVCQEAVDGGHRVLVFSQFTTMLDLIAPALDTAALKWVRLDGSTRDRQAVVERFQSDPTLAVFLISLKAGGVGLNLTGADTVIHFDPWWNPAAEAQATDRAHRIGQKNVVNVIKLIARDSVEGRVIAMQSKKRELLDGAIDSADPIDPADLQSLVG